MLAWIVDHANVFYFLLGAAALGLLMAGWLTRRAKYWSYAAIAIGGMVMLWALSLFVITDRKQIELNLDAMAQAALNHDTEAFLRHLAKDFRFGTLDRKLLANLVTASSKSRKVVGVRLWGQQTTVTGDTAETLFNFRADADSGGFFIASARARFVRDGQNWKMREIQIYKIGTTEPIHVPGVN